MDNIMEKALKETINELVVELANIRFQKNIAIQRAASAESQVTALNQALETEKAIREAMETEKALEQTAAKDPPVSPV